MKKEKRSAKKKKKGKSFSVSQTGLAFKNEFYLETIWILSLMFEQKAKSVLKKTEQAQTVQAYSFEQCIKRIKYHHLSGRIPQIERHLNLDLIEEMRTWKNNRNIMLKDMVNVHVSQKRMERLASEGITLYKKWTSSLKQVKKMLKNPGTDAIQIEKTV
jgi:hypothetical protein